MLLLAFLVLEIGSQIGYCQWDPNRAFDQNPNFDPSLDIPGKTLPPYIDWRQNFRFDPNIRFQQIDRTTQQQTVRGISVPGHYDTSTFINMFLGIPYAQPPVGLWRFERPQNLDLVRREGILQAWYYRPACPQPFDLLQQQIANFTYTSEDCLYLNIFEPNITSQQVDKRYPVLVFFHGGMFNRGSAIQYPGLVLAQRNYIVVTVQYRLGPLGFLTTGDKFARGNFGLFDQMEALRWIQMNIGYFHGLSNQITIMGHEAGAASVGLHLISPQMRNPPGGRLFSRAILMSASDLSQWAVIPKNNDPGEYARALARALSCPFESSENMINCMRQKSAQDLVLAALTVSPRFGATSGPFAPTVDANQADGYVGFLPDDPAVMRTNYANIQDVPVLAGFTKDDGSLIVAKNFTSEGWFRDISTQVSVSEFARVVRNITARRYARDRTQVQNAINFQYTYWANPQNGTARRQMLIDMFTDEFYASGVDALLKSQARSSESRNSTGRVWMYKWDYTTQNTEPSMQWLGAYNGLELQYIFGWPYLNKTYQNITGIQLKTSYSDLDRNVSNATMQMWKDFADLGNPIPTQNGMLIFNFVNKSWYPFKTNNITYFRLDYNSTNMKDYSQSKLAFWNYYIYQILPLEPYTTTPVYPTHWPYQDYQIATFTLSGAVFILLIIFVPLLYITCRRREESSSSGKESYY